MGYVGGKSITDVTDTSYTDTTRVSAYTYLQGVGVGGPNSAELPPDLALNFDGSRRLEAQGLSYTSRGSNAMQYDSQGRLVWAPANMLTYSDQFDNVAWSKAAISVSGNAAYGPDGTLSADKLIESSSPISHAVYRTFSVSASTRYTLSVRVKAAERQWLELILGPSSYFGSVGVSAYFNVATGAVGTVTSHATALPSATITPLGSDWYLCSLSATTNAISGAATLYLFLAIGDSSDGYTGDGTSGIYIWGAQLERAGIDSPKPYNATTSAAYYAPRLDYDPGTLQPKGLFLEEAGTNLLTWSTNLDTATGGWTNTDTTVSTSSVIGPDGFPCQLLTEGVAGTSIHTKSATVTAATDFFCYSVYAKRGNTDWLRLDVIDGSSNGAEAWYNLALGTAGALNLLGTGTATANYIEPVGNGWYRCAIIGKAVVGTSLTARSCNTSANNSTTRVNNATRNEFGPQLESVSGASPRWASSYIPTYSATATRNADSTPWMAVGGWFNASAGTVVCEYSTPQIPAPQTSSPILWSINQDNNNRIVGFTTISGQSLTNGFGVTTGGVDRIFASTPSNASWQVKQSYAWASSDYASYNQVGQSITSATVGALPTTPTLNIGVSTGTGTVAYSRWIKSFKYYARRRPNAELQALADLTSTPQVDLGFLSYGQNQGLLDRRLTWTDRASNATMFDSQGRLVYAPANMLAASQDFSSAFWGKIAILSTSGAAVAPDGTPTAQLVVPDTTNSQHYMTQNSVSYGVTMFSVYAKAGGYSWLGMAGAQNGAFTTFDLQNGVIGSVGTNTQATITAVGNGWYRCTVAQAYVGQVNYLFIEPNNSQATWTPNGTSGIYLWGAQYEQVGVDSPKPYIRTETAAVYQPRIDYDPATGTCLGLLLEEQRTNLLVRSDDFSNASWLKSGVTVTANSAIAPDGSLTADTVIVNSGAQTYVQLCQDLTALTASASYTVSAYVKKAGAQYAVVGWLYSSGIYGAVSYNLDTQSVSASVGAGGFTITGTSITSVGNGWYRITVTATTPSSANYSRFPFVFPRVTAWTAGGARPDGADTGDGVSGLYIWGAQLEAGAFPTSYIPTYGSTATRNADYAPYMPLPYSPNAHLGTYVTNAMQKSVGTNSFRLSCASDVTALNNLANVISTSKSLSGSATVAGVFGSSGSDTANQITLGSMFRASGMWTGTPNVKLCLNGGTVATTTIGASGYPSTNLPVFTTGNLYPTVVTGQGWYSRIRRYHNFAFSDAQLQALGSPSLPIGPA